MRLRITIILSLLLLTACTDNNQPAASPTITGTFIPTTTESSTLLSEEKIHLFTPVQTYDESDVVTIELNNDSISTKFFTHRFEPFGFYIPDNMEAIQYEDGVEWSLIDSYGKITIDWYNDDVEQLTLMNEELISYAEYAASDKSYDTIRDYFILDHDNKKYQITVMYSENEKENVLPLLLKVIETLKYIEKR